MRLLKIEENGDLRLVEYMDEKEIPPYAILSHRWGSDNEEVTLRDVLEGTGTRKTGYDKIHACGHQATLDGLKLFWVDTCCIDKTSSAELSEAINSMWRWYHNSRVCYAYLNDVPVDADTTTRDHALAESKWFTRGWTLQELLAPSEVILYDTAWQRIGTRTELAAKITEITNIDASYLRPDASEFANASIAEKMSWASMRQTKRIEDSAYSLLGIFDINMPLLYGEGAKAFYRLQEEIMKQSDDQSIFIWSQNSSLEERSGVLLAPSPAHFKNCGNIMQSADTRGVKPYAMTNRGLHAEFPVLGRGDLVIAVLNCRYGYDVFCDLGIWLNRNNDGSYRRSCMPLQEVPVTYWSRGRPQQMYLKTLPGSDRPQQRSVKTAPGNFSFKGGPGDDSCIIRKLPENYMVAEIYPPCPPLHATSLNTSCIQAQVRTEDTRFASRTMVLVKPQLPRDIDELPAIVIVIYNREDSSRWVKDVGLLPNSIGEDIDLVTIYSNWEFRDLSSLQRVKSFATGTVVLHVASRQVRSSRIAIIDVSISSHRLRPALERMVRISTSISRSRAFSFIRSHIFWLLYIVGNVIVNTLDELEQSRNSNSIDRWLYTVTIILLVTTIGLVVYNLVHEATYREKLQAWVDSRHRGTLHVVSAINDELLFLIFTSCLVFFFCIPSGVSGASTILLILAAVCPAFFALQMYKWGNWI